MLLEPSELIKVISSFSILPKIWNEKYINSDSQNGFQHPWLNRLAEDPDEEIICELKKLDNYLSRICKYEGFDKLFSGLRAHNIENFSSTIAEIKTDAWISMFHKLVEIRPKLPNSESESDFKLCLDGLSLFGEVWQARDLPSSRIGNAPVHITKQNVEEPKRSRLLWQKGQYQLPPHIIGVWVAHIYHATLENTFIDVFNQDMASRSNVLGTVLWVRAGSNRFDDRCTRCKDLKDDEHGIYWLDNRDCEYIDLKNAFILAVT